MSSRLASGRLTARTYDAIREWILPTVDELRWCDIPWRRSLDDAVAVARDADMPLLLWAMDGHPFESTCSNGIIGRRTVWPDPAVRALVERFVPAADDAGTLRRGSGRGPRAFRVIAEQGHFAECVVPTDTRQGIYAATPAGALLGSVTTNDPRRVERMLRDALARWDALSPRERRAAAGMPLGTAVGAGTPTADDTAPDDLVLHVFSRDLWRVPAVDVGAPPASFVDVASASPWNLGRGRFSAADARTLLPVPRIGARREVAAAVARHIARHHLVDNVRGQTVPFDDDAIETAVLIAEVAALDGDLVGVGLHGEMRASARGRWPVRGTADRDTPEEQARGYAMTLFGRGTFDRARDRFAHVELVAAGVRWGATQYNARADDRGPAPMGVVLTSDDLHGVAAARQRSANAAARS